MAHASTSQGSIFLRKTGESVLHQKDMQYIIHYIKRKQSLSTATRKRANKIPGGLRNTISRKYHWDFPKRILSAKTK